MACAQPRSRRGLLRFSESRQSSGQTRTMRSPMAPAEPDEHPSGVHSLSCPYRTASPRTTTEERDMAWIPCTTPIVLPPASNTGPCSIWASRVRGWSATGLEPTLAASPHGGGGSACPHGPPFNVGASSILSVRRNSPVLAHFWQAEAGRTAFSASSSHAASPTSPPPTPTTAPRPSRSPSPCRPRFRPSALSSWDRKGYRGRGEPIRIARVGQGVILASIRGG
jgi:hypothetical protein